MAAGLAPGGNAAAPVPGLVSPQAAALRFAASVATLLAGCTEAARTVRLARGLAALAPRQNVALHNGAA